MSYLDSGFNENLIRNQYPNSTTQYDSVNIGEILSEGAITDAKIALMNGAKLVEDSVTGDKILELTVSKLIAGTLGAVANVGNGNVQIDGVNKRITINDGTNDRILIGYLAGKF